MRPLTFGTSVGFQNPVHWRRPWRDLYADTMDFVTKADDLHIDMVWLTEHHFADDGYCPSLLPVAANIAARTKTIRIGTKALLLPFHDPVRLAEDAAVVDIVSGGRLDLGLAAGYRAEEFKGFNLRLEDRGKMMSESLDILRLALTGEPFEYQGHFHRYGRLAISPPPVQQPVPIWLGGRSEAAMRRAARRGCHLMLADFSLAIAEDDCKTYIHALQAEGRDPGDYEIAAVAVVFVDEDRERAWRAVEPHLLYQQNQYRRWFSEVSDRQTDHYETILQREQLEGGAYFIGNPDDVAEGIRAFRERVPFTHFGFWTLLPGMDVTVAMRSLELFAGRVVPLLH